MKHVHLPMYEDQYYYIYNRGNNSSPIFYKQANCNFFLHELRNYLQTYLNFYAFKLLRSEFHLVVKVKNFNLIPECSRTVTKGKYQLFKPQEIVSEQFRKFFTCYAKAINLQEKNTGSVFEKNFKRFRVGDRGELKKQICEIHNLESSYNEPNISSFSSIIEGKDCFVERNEILNWFGGINAFIDAHAMLPVLSDDTCSLI